jgi:hypothetical protein
MATTKTKVKSDFSYARDLMRQAEKLMSEGISDFSNDGHAGQLALELSASASTFLQYVEERQ